LQSAVVFCPRTALKPAFSRVPNSVCAEMPVSMM
jgi:hypothetical protein